MSLNPHKNAENSTLYYTPAHVKSQENPPFFGAMSINSGAQKRKFVTIGRNAEEKASQQKTGWVIHPVLIHTPQRHIGKIQQTLVFADFHRFPDFCFPVETACYGDPLVGAVRKLHLQIVRGTAPVSGA